MKRHADTEGRVHYESAGPLFEWTASHDTRSAGAARFGARLDLDPDRAYDEHLRETRAIKNERCRTVPEFNPAPEVERIFPREVAELRRDLGMSRASNAAARKAPGWEDAALDNLREFARRVEHFSIEDFREAYPVPSEVNPKALGGVVRRACNLGIVAADGFVLVNCSNRSPRVRWKSLVFERNRIA